MQGFLEYILKGLVKYPEEVTVTPAERSGMTIYELRMNPSDVGRVIGRQGMTINAIRSLLTAGSARKGIRCSLEIVEDKPAPAGAAAPAPAAVEAQASAESAKEPPAQ